MRAATLFAIAILGLASLPAPGQKMVSRYEPSQRLRSAIDTCHKDEVMNGAWCVKKCQAGFLLDTKSHPPVCFTTQVGGARYVPPPPGWEPKESTKPKPESNVPNPA